MSKKCYVFYPSPYREEPKDAAKILADLGRATKRGIKKCFKCGTYNGTRGLMCKNKQCDAIFKECGEKQRANLGAIKLISGASRQVFSVRVRDKGPDCRGFVQLPLIQGSNEAKEKNVALSEVALCFVDSCQRLFDDSILKCHETDQNKVASVCIHIKSALKSVNVAIPIETKNCLLNLFGFDEDVKQKLWQLSTETEGALVQQVSKTVMAVKCQVTPKHPLGYLHFTFCVTKGKVTYDKFYCSCLNFKAYSCLNNTLAQFNQKCIHFYACIWAFTSDARFTEEFIDFLNLELYIGNEFLMRRAANENLHTNLQKLKHCNEKANQQNQLHQKQKPQLKANARCIYHTEIMQQKQKKLKPSAPTKKQKIDHSAEQTALLSFITWLTFVTERINQVLCSKHNERAESLTFFIPLKFFELLANRLESSSKKANHLYVIKGAAEISYLIFSIPYLREVFNTSQVSLQIMEIFIQNKQGAFVRMCQELHKLEYKQFITFLKVGAMKSDNTFPFTINWTSKILPVSNFGKLEIIFHAGCCDAEQFNKRFL